MLGSKFFKYLTTNGTPAVHETTYNDYRNGICIGLLSSPKASFITIATQEFQFVALFDSNLYDAAKLMQTVESFPNNIDETFDLLLT